MIKTSIKIYFSMLLFFNFKCSIGIFFYLQIGVLFFSCSTLEDISDPAPPIGSINWLIEVDDKGHRLLENSESNLIIGILSASDPNPYDEVTFSLASQMSMV